MKVEEHQRKIQKDLEAENKMLKQLLLKNTHGRGDSPVKTGTKEEVQYRVRPVGLSGLV